MEPSHPLHRSVILEFRFKKMGRLLRFNPASEVSQKGEIGGRRGRKFRREGPQGARRVGLLLDRNCVQTAREKSQRDRERRERRERSRTTGTIGNDGNDRERTARGDRASRASRMKRDLSVCVPSDESRERPSFAKATEGKASKWSPNSSSERSVASEPSRTKRDLSVCFASDESRERASKGSGDEVPRSRLEAPPGIEPGMEVLQTSALPLGDGAMKTSQQA